MEEHRLPKKSGVSFHVDEGETFQVINPEGEQIADMVAFNRDDPTEKFSQSYTRHINGRLRITTGHSLYTTEGNSILTITQDECGVHDILYGPCNEWMLSEMFPDEPGGCRENLWLSLEPKGFTEEDVPDTMNIFQKSTVTGQTYMDLRRSPANPGDTIEFRADQDAIVAVSACSAADIANGDELTPIDIRVPNDSSLDRATVQEGHVHEH